MSSFLFIDAVLDPKTADRSADRIIIDGVTTQLPSGPSKIDAPDRGAVYAIIETPSLGRWSGYLPTRTSTPIHISPTDVLFGGHPIPSTEASSSDIFKSPWVWLLIAAIVVVAFMYSRR
jgi:hypothetical protein